jgi:predicted nucleotidyltransferase
VRNCGRCAAAFICGGSIFFGSAARGGFDPEQNDIDFLVEFDRGHPDALSLKTYFGF